MKQAIFVFIIGIFAMTAGAQTRKPAPKKPVSTPKVITSSTLPTTSVTVSAGAQKVSIQIKNVTKFIYSLGGIAQGMEAIDKDQKANNAARDANAANKASVLQAIRNLRAGLAALEVEFRTNANLKRFLPQIQGINDLSAQSEDLASRGQFAVAGKPLLLVVERLSDTLAAMP
ncbi:MAG: hypothetical protein ACRD6X_17285 [Pyrinomonadaceae bacterium]